ncbi:hypothetical protein [Sciscionella marina]|uniref:hypothetical protein n=1 Tax=Sciscionella marina TaxID=508770 RepID=UPI000368DACC|nr:hypothetical protein [Sciscionella marina]
MNAGKCSAVLSNRELFDHADGGLTTEDNMVLLCAYHHTLIHNTEWQVNIHNGLA